MSRVEFRRYTTENRRAAENRVLMGGAVGIALVLFAAGLTAGPPEPAQTVPLSRTPSEPTPTHPSERVLFNGLTAPEVLISNLEKPNSPLLSDLQSTFDRDGVFIEEYWDCSKNTSSMKRSFINPATERSAPFKVARAIRQIEAGEDFTAPLEVAINSVTGRTPREVWMARIEGDQITWAAKEEKYRQYAVNVFPESQCQRFSLYFDYRTQTPAQKRN